MQGNKINVFYTATTFYDVAERNAGGGGIAPDAVIAKALGNIHANQDGVTFDGFEHTKLLEPDGKLYQNKAQNPGFAFRDPYTFADPAHPGKTFMVFEGNTGGTRGDYKCKQEDLGYRPGDPHAETLDQVNTTTGAWYQTANVGLAVADNKDLTKWSFLPPILSANCVNDQTERPQIFIQNENGKNKYYLFTISHQFTYADGMRGPDGVYGFVGNGVRSDFQPVNNSGLALGSPTDLNMPANAPEGPDPRQNGRQFQAYSHYVQPGGLVQSFIDNVDGVRGGSLSPTVKMNFQGGVTQVDRTFGKNGLGPFGYLPTNLRVGGEGLYK